ncbi:MAG: YihY family inner membrane protein [Armatimonadetes bacterium]|nr:YihY family inner membrane protein [Armatimonadota bacterium]
MNSKFVVFLKAFWKKFREEGVFKESAALTFVTLLGFVPFIIFILFFIPELPFLKSVASFKDVLISVFVPSSADQIYNYILQITNSKIPFNFFNFIVLLITSYSLFKIINDSFDNILNAHEIRKKSFFSDIIKFFGMSIFGSLLILILLSATSFPIVSKFYDIPILQGISLYVTPFILLFIIFTLGFIYIPSVKVSTRSIAIGAAISSGIWIFFKAFFNFYIIHLTNIQVIFGVLASVPIFLFWIYANWIIILGGVIIVSILEKRHIKNLADRKDKQLVRITFEKIINAGEREEISSTALNAEKVKQIISEIVNEQPD